MKQKRFSVEQVVAVLKQAQLGALVADLIVISGLPSRRSLAGCGDMPGSSRSKSGSLDSYRTRVNAAPVA